MNRYSFVAVFYFWIVAIHAVPWPGFDESMKTELYSQVINSDETEKSLGMPGEQLYDFFRFLFAKNFPATIIPSSSVRIPKIIHQIWIGKAMPAEFEAYQQSWKEHHPDWEYKLWTQHDIDKYEWTNKDLIKQSHNPGEISDMMRYEILYRYGGVYIDTDFECLQALDQLHYMYDFYIGIQPLDSDIVQLGIGIIGSIPGHPIIKACIDRMKDTWYTKEYEQKATARTGPLYFTKIFYDVADRSKEIDIAFPAGYFYPLGCNEDEVKKNEWIQQGAYGIHHWAKSWLVKEFRKPEFRSIQNY